MATLLNSLLFDITCFSVEQTCRIEYITWIWEKMVIKKVLHFSQQPNLWDILDDRTWCALSPVEKYHFDCLYRKRWSDRAENFREY